MTPLRLLAIITFWLFGAGFSSATIKIACVGDSITAGAGVNTPALESYPAKLQKLLGTNYVVQNDGLSGSTLLKNGDLTYWNSSPCATSHVLPIPNIVIIMLGSNDSKPQNWAYGSNFIRDYDALIATYTNLTTHPRTLICTPPPVFNNGNFNINPGVVATNIAPIIREIGTNLSLQVIDMHSLLAGHNEWFPDNVHPNSQGTSVMAAIVYTALLGDTMNGLVPGLGINILPDSKAVLNWPAGGAGWVLQSTPALGDTNIWTVVSQPSTTDGTFITNSVAGQTAMFRLWWPSN